MKKVMVCFFAILVASGMLGALENALIDFSQIVDDYQGEHSATYMDYSDAYVGMGFAEEEQQIIQSSLNIPNWIVRLVDSSRSIINDSLSYVKAVTVNDASPRFSGEQVLGVRVHFPEMPHNSYAWVEPPFTIPPYSTSKVEENPPVGEQFVGWGVLKNVGVIKRVEVNTYGMNHPIGFGIVLEYKDEFIDKTYTMRLGNLDFEGWRTLSWNNPNYISDVRNRPLKKTPLYPMLMPSITLKSIEYFKGAEQMGGDFINYVKDINITYDKGVIDGIETDISHEQVWGILEKRERERFHSEATKMVDTQILRYIESQNMHVETTDDAVTEPVQQ